MEFRPTNVNTALSTGGTTNTVTITFSMASEDGRSASFSQRIDSTDLADGKTMSDLTDTEKISIAFTKFKTAIASATLYSDTTSTTTTTA